MDTVEVVILIISFCFGAILGSFACCQAWRLRLKQTGKKDPGKWSVCLSCGKKLKTAEKIPIFSWLLQRGRCKKCGAKIGKAEIFSELTLGLSLVGFTALFYPEINLAITTSQIAHLIILIAMALLQVISLTLMWILLIYDAKWQQLPVKFLTILNACAIIYIILRFVGLAFDSADGAVFLNFALSTLAAVALLAGTYFCLYLFSKERLVGSGDWLLALPIALLLGNWWLALITLFLSNTLGSIFGITLKIKKGIRQIPFGPFLIIAFVIVYVAQPWLLNLITGL